MIRTETGEFKMDDYELIIHPELSREDFVQGDIRISGSEVVTETGFTTYRFAGCLDGFGADFAINFRFENLHRLLFRSEDTLSRWRKFREETAAAEKLSKDAWVQAVNKWGKITGDGERIQKGLNDTWLARTIGAPPPYEYEWGVIGSEIEPHLGEAVIAVRFCHSFS